MRALLTPGVVLAFILQAHAAPNWKEILGPAQGMPAGPANYVVTWRTNLVTAMEEAREQNLPLFVTFRCLPCKQCSAFDKEVLEGGTDLDPLLTKFVTVRLTDAAAIDLRIFPLDGFVDLDLSWWGWFLSPEGRVYGVFGGRDHVSDATRISKAALIASIERVLAHHSDPRRLDWNIDGLPPQRAGAAITPRDLPGYEGWRRMSHEGERKQTCIHCHQVNDILRQPAVAAGTFDKQRGFDVWPLPENVGLSLDRDHGLLVTNVTAGSPADQAGLRPGDVLGAAGGRRCFSQADFRGALHRGPRSAGKMEVWWIRNHQPMSGTLAIKEDWRKTVLDWRMSVSQGIVGAYPGFFPLIVKDAKRDQFKIPRDRMAVEPYMGNSTNSAPYRAGLRGSHVVTAINGASPNLNGRAFLVWFIQRFDPGDQITVTSLDKTGQKRDVTYQLPLREK